MGGIIHSGEPLTAIKMRISLTFRWKLSELQNIPRRWDFLRPWKNGDMAFWVKMDFSIGFHWNLISLVEFLRCIPSKAHASLFIGGSRGLKPLPTPR